MAGKELKTAAIQMLIRMDQEDAIRKTQRMRLEQIAADGEAKALTNDCSAQLLFAQGATMNRQTGEMLVASAQANVVILQGMETAAWEAYWDCESP